MISALRGGTWGCRANAASQRTRTVREDWLLGGLMRWTIFSVFHPNRTRIWPTVFLSVCLDDGCALCEQDHSDCAKGTIYKSSAFAELFDLLGGSLPACTIRTIGGAWRRLFGHAAKCTPLPTHASGTNFFRGRTKGQRDFIHAVFSPSGIRCLTTFFLFKQLNALNRDYREITKGNCRIISWICYSLAPWVRTDLERTLSAWLRPEYVQWGDPRS